MFRLTRPTDDDIQQTIDLQRQQQFTYADVGATSELHCPTGFSPNHQRYRLGEGAECFQRAREALLSWRMLDLGWLDVVHRQSPPQPDTMIAMLARSMMLYSLNVGRVIYVDDDAEARRCALGYGTLPAYPLCGEERFCVELNPQTNEVDYEIFSFSRPANWLIRAGLPHVRRLQRAFCRDSSAAMASAVKGST